MIYAIQQNTCRENPYLFKAKALNTAESLVRSLLDAHLSSQEEGIFGAFLEELAIFICGRVYDGQKSSAEGIDLEFENEEIRYIVSIKSGPNWGNSGQIAKMKDHFKKAKRILGTNVSKIKVAAVNGCCYGKVIVQIRAIISNYVVKDFGSLFQAMKTCILKLLNLLGIGLKNILNVLMMNMQRSLIDSLLNLPMHIVMRAEL